MTDGERNLCGKYFQRFDGGPVRTQAIAGGIHTQQAQGRALVVLQRNDQEIIRIPGGAGGQQSCQAALTVTMCTSAGMIGASSTGMK